MNKRVKILIGILALFLLLSGSYMASMFRAGTDEVSVKANPNYRLSAEEKGLIEEGDIILRRGEGFISGVIAHLNSDAPYDISHCAFLTRGQKDWMVIHAVSGSLAENDGLQAEPIDRFTGTSVDSSVVILRYKADRATRLKFSRSARAYLDARIAFDNSFNLEDTTTFYCTELLHRVFVNVLGEDLFPERFEEGHPGYIHFDQLLNPSKFDLIVNHQGKAVSQFMEE